MSAPFKLSRVAPAAAILLAATVAVAPEIARGVSCGHDFDFHLVSWFDCLASWRHGIFYPHWAPSANFNAGEPRFVFYPPLTWMLGAALGAVFPWTWVPVLVTWLFLAATGLSVRALVRPWLTDGFAALAGAAALFSGYSLFTAFERTAVGEMAGGFLIPLLLLFLFRDRRPRATALGRARDGAFDGAFDEAFDGSTVPLALTLAACWLSNAPLGLMASYLMAALALALALARRSWAPVARALVAAPLGLGLAAIYLLPAIMEQPWVAIRQAVEDPGLDIQNSWLFARHPALPLLALHDAELHRVSIIAVAMIALCLAGLAVAAWRGRLPARQVWLPLTLIPLAVLILQLPVSAPVWEHLPRLAFLQFPWRWLVAVEAPMGFWFALGLQALLPGPSPLGTGDGRKSVALPLALSTVLFLALTLLANHFYFQPCDEDDAVPGMVQAAQSGLGFEGVDEYSPPGADAESVSTNLPGACLVADPTATLGQGPEDQPPDWAADQGSCLATAEFAPDLPDHLRLQTTLACPGFLVVRLRVYPAWQIRLNGRPAQLAATREDGLYAFKVPAGPIALTADWTTTPATRLGRSISLAALWLAAAVFLLERRRRRPGLS